jgi:tetratricopeptide (TPR) repeat protein
LALAAPETEFALGAFYFCCDLNFDEALRHFEAALPGMPNDSTLQRLTGFVKFQLGRFDDGIASGLRAVELNPLELQNTIDLVIYYSMLRRYPAAVVAGDRASSLARAGMGPSLGAAGGMVELARFAIDNDLGGLVRSLRSLPARPSDPSGLFRDYECAMLEGDLPAAARHLANPQLDGRYYSLGPAGGPVALHRAYVARLRGQFETAAEEARKATTQLRAMTPGLRQRPFVAVQLARAAACAGAIGDARRLADELRRELPTIFLMDRLAVLSELARTYALMDAREEALDCLRTLMTGPIIAGNAATYCSPNAIRIDPCWSRLKTDPRFEEILQSAKPL